MRPVRVDYQARLVALRQHIDTHNVDPLVQELVSTLETRAARERSWCAACERLTESLCRLLGVTT